MVTIAPVSPSLPQDRFLVSSSECHAASGAN